MTNTKSSNSNNPKTLKELSKEVDRLINEVGGYWDTPWLIAAIMEELGELTKLIQISEGLFPWKEKPPYEEIREEFGDFFFCVLCLANVLNVDLIEATSESLEKWESRDKKNWQQFKD